VKFENFQALVYSDLFDYPLTYRELARWRIGDKIRIKTSGLIEEKDGYFFLKGREELIKLRKEREKYSKKKWVEARRAASKLQGVPWIKMIGVTGALAMNNAKEEDDIDFFVITSKDSLWLTRFLIWFICPFLGIKRRARKDKDVKDKICFNLFLDESNLKIEPENLFLAHEICQVRPLLNKDKTYEKFIKANEWVEEYLPNALNFKRINRQSSQIMSTQAFSFLAILNRIAFFLQYHYMKSKITSEKITLTAAFFHPANSQKILHKYFQLFRKV